MNRGQTLINRLISYCNSECYPFHMPGHKRNRDLWKDAFPDPFSVDITEIDGFDDLHHADGILKESMEWAASVYGADQTYYLINGSSCGILSAICGVTTNEGRILMSRNCHKSAYHAVFLNHLKTIYSYPQNVVPFGISGGISPEKIENLLIKYPDTQAVFVVSPTYDGVVSDIQRIADIVHRYHLPLIVDEAHGAHFSYGKKGEFPVSSLMLGADVVIQSLHKTLPSLTQTAVMHIKEGYLDPERIKWYLSVYQSSSPSYVLLSSIESCIFDMNLNGRKQMELFFSRLMVLRERLSHMKCLKLAGRELSGQFDIADFDLSKLLISCRGCKWKNETNEWISVSGSFLSKRLREKYCLEIEMAAVDYIIAITTCMDTTAGLKRLEEALLEIDGELRKDTSEEGGADLQQCEMECSDITIFEGLSREKEQIYLNESEGRISAEFIYVYPPGIPILVPGERITGQILNLVKQYQETGLSVLGAADHTLKCIGCVKE